MHSIFEVWSPDTVAECMSGVGSLYEKLWSLVEETPPANEVNDNFGDRALGLFWDRFTDEEKALLDAAALKEFGED
jgi:hypothetical protein